MPITTRVLRAFAIARSLFAKTTLADALERLGFVQADPIRAPARAQDLTLRHRVVDYRSGELERRYVELAIEEDTFINYGFLPRRHARLMLPRAPRRPWDRPTTRRAALVLAFVRERSEAHPRDVDARFDHGSVTNYWGGSSNATTQLLEQMHHRGLLRVVRRDAGIRVYAPRALPKSSSSKRARAAALLALVIHTYAPLPLTSLGPLVSRLRHALPQLGAELTVAHACQQLACARVDGVDWLWPLAEDPTGHEVVERVRLLAPFDPVVWDRRRFELFWGWAYRFEAYTPVSQRKLGYYALPLLWRDEVIGWANVAVANEALVVDLGYVAGHPPRERAFKPALAAELMSMRAFLGVS